MPNLTSTQAIDIAQRVLQAHDLTYDEREGFNADFVEKAAGSAEAGLPHWRVAYVSAPGMFEQHDFFMHLADETGALLYILGPHGRLRLKRHN